MAQRHEIEIKCLTAHHAQVEVEQSCGIRHANPAATPETPCCALRLADMLTMAILVHGFFKYRRVDISKCSCRCKRQLQPKDNFAAPGPQVWIAKCIGRGLGATSVKPLLRWQQPLWSRVLVINSHSAVGSEGSQIQRQFNSEVPQGAGIR